MMQTMLPTTAVVNCERCGAMFHVKGVKPTQKVICWRCYRGNGNG